MLVWTPNSKKVKQHWLHRECVSWGRAHSGGVEPMKLVGRAQGMRAMSFLESGWAILRSITEDIAVLI